MKYVVYSKLHTSNSIHHAARRVAHSATASPAEQHRPPHPAYTPRLPPRHSYEMLQGVSRWNKTRGRHRAAGTTAPRAPRTAPSAPLRHIRRGERAYHRRAHAPRQAGGVQRQRRYGQGHRGAIVSGDTHRYGRARYIYIYLLLDMRYIYVRRGGARPDLRPIGRRASRIVAAAAVASAKSIEW